MVEEHNYLIEPPRWREQQQQDENEEEKVNEDGDLEIPSPRAEPILEEEDDGGKCSATYFPILNLRISRVDDKAEVLDSGDGAQSGRRKLNQKYHHHSRNQEMSNNLPEIKEHEVVEQLFSVGDESSIVGENKHQKPLLDGNRISADH